MNLLLAITDLDYSKPIEAFGDKLSFGGMMLGIGMLAVFSVLCLLWGALVIFKIVFYDMPAKKKNDPAPVEPAPITVMQAPVAPSADEEIIAVLAAAIAMAESENVGAKFRVVSFKRK